MTSQSAPPEAWMLHKFGTTSDGGLRKGVARLWEEDCDLWRAAQAAAYEEAAKIAWAEESDPPAESHEFIDGWMQGCHAVAAAIRAAEREGGER